MNVKNIYLALISDSVIFYQNGNKLECQFSIIYVQKIYTTKNQEEKGNLFSKYEA